MKGLILFALIMTGANAQAAVTCQANINDKYKFVDLEGSSKASVYYSKGEIENYGLLDATASVADDEGDIKVVAIPGKKIDWEKEPKCYKVLDRLQFDFPGTFKRGTVTKTKTIATEPRVICNVPRFNFRPTTENMRCW